MCDPIGKIEYFDSGETVFYELPEDFLTAIAHNLDVLGINGWQYTALIDDPKLKYNAYTLVSNEFGLDPPSFEEFFQSLRSM